MIATRIATLLKTHGWAMNLVFIALAAYFVAGAGNAIVARSVRVIPSADDMGASRGPPRSALPPKASGFTVMAERNLFAAKRENLSPVEDTETEAASDDLSGSEYDRNQLKPCSLPVSLRGTLVAEGSPQWSMALIYVNAERDTQVFTINEGSNKVLDDAWLVDILDREMVVRRRDHFELCAAEGESPVAVAPGLHAPAPMASSSEESSGEGVEKVSENEFRIERAERDRVFNNLSEIATQARIVPSFKNGKPNGFKLFSIKPNSIFSKIGLQNGDVIQKVNGYQMDSPDKALELYQKLKDSGSISVDLLRRGQNQSFSYQVQ